MGSKYDTDSHTLRTTTWALCFSAGEYAYLVWSRSAYAKKIDIILNKEICLVTGCLRPTSVPKLYIMSVITPPHIRREVYTRKERTKQIMDVRNLMHEQISLYDSKVTQIKTKFLWSEWTLNKDTSRRTPKKWKEKSTKSNIIKEALSSGHQLPYRDWMSLNRIRTGTARTRVNLVKWSIEDWSEIGI